MQNEAERPEEQLQDDSPIDNVNQDRFRRTQFVQNLAKALITETKQKTKSKVIALTGKWGVGKSSVINMVKNEIKKSENKNLYVLDFNPWQFTDSDDLIKPFLEELYLAIDGEKGKVKNIRKVIANYYKSFNTENIKMNFFDLITAIIALIGGIMAGNEAKNAAAVLVPVIRNVELKTTQVNFNFLYWGPVILFGFLFIQSVYRFVKTKITSNVSFAKKTLVEQKK